MCAARGARGKRWLVYSRGLEAGPGRVWVGGSWWGYGGWGGLGAQPEAVVEVYRHLCGARCSLAAGVLTQFKSWFSVQLREWNK